MAMSRRKVQLIPLVSILLAFGPFGPPASGKEPGSMPVLQVDHIMIRADDPAKLYAFFHEVLQLPIAWPLATRGRVTSGGVGFGNVNVEAIHFPEQTPSDAQLVGFGFEPAPLAQCLGELDRRGITYGDPRPFVMTEANGSKRTLFTNVTLRQFSDADRPATATVHIFLSEYSPTYLDVEQRRERLRRAVRESGGGPLGVMAVQEVILGATDWPGATALWEKLLAPRRPSAPGRWQVGDGPAIRVVRAVDNRPQAFVIGVGSLPRARAFLHEKGLLGSVSEHEITIDPSRIQGLDIRLRETKE
jgi:catechol 2,3-dioxygenase-like lactoylglutathione lyase family enzyme